MHITKDKTDDDERISLIALSMIDGMNTTMVTWLLKHFGRFTDILAALRKPCEAIPLLGHHTYQSIIHSIDKAQQRAEKEWLFIQTKHIRLYAFTDPDFPYRLHECNEPPIAIYYKGTADLNAQRVVSIVGTRNSTDYGRRMTEELVQGLAEFDPELLVISGLAHGIDVCAHRKAMQVGLPTVGILGHGLNRIYPADHRDTAIRMLSQGGGLLTDYPSDATVAPENFLKRNRLIAAIADAIVVVESSKRGGAMSTATAANDDYCYREVYTYPGRVGDDHSSGCLQLIRQLKARLITSSHDLIYDMIWDISKASRNPQTQLDSNE